MSDDQATASPETPARRRSGVARILLRVFLLLLVPGLFIFAGATYYYATGRYISTENAYVKAPLVVITSEVTGRIAEVYVRENQHVERGARLLKLESHQFEIAVQEAKAALANARLEIEGRRSELRQAEVEISVARERRRYLETQYKREKKLTSRGVGRAMKLDEAQHLLRAAERLQLAAREKRQRLLTKLGGDPKIPVESHPLYLAALAKLKRAELDLARTHILAPEAGVIAKMTFQPGEHVEDSKPLFMLVNDRKTWIEANLKETELTHIKPGQSATFVADAYPDIEWTARVAGISPATGAQFAVLPPQNASGNWVKVVQRLPVRLVIDDVNVKGKPRLRAGMTVTVTIDSERERKAPPLISKVLAMTKRVVGVDVAP